MRALHIGERLGVEEAHMLEFQQLNATWDKAMADYEENAEKLRNIAVHIMHATVSFGAARIIGSPFPHHPLQPVFSPSLVETMKQRHKVELEEYQKRILAKQQKPKFSTELLNYRNIQDHLAKAKDYTEAHKVKAKADRLEAEETEKWLQKRQEGLFQQEEKWKQQKHQELAALQKRIQTGREGQKKQRRLELERLVQRYQNVRNELDAQQNLERLRIEKQFQRVA